MKSSKVRFRDFPDDNSRQTLIHLLHRATGRNLIEVSESKSKVDFEITGPYSPDSDSIRTPLNRKIVRGFYSKTSKGAHISKAGLATGITPSSSARKNVWFTGENERPPFGDWDAYLSFETRFFDERNIYFPLWLVTSTNLISTLDYSYWGIANPRIESFIEPRKLNESKRKFACAFIGKNYPHRLHAIRALRKIGKVDVFGAGVRRPVQNPSLIAKDYKFAICFENDLYPGYVTEKPFEAYLSGTVPLYDGIDTENYLNREAMLNLSQFESTYDWIEMIAELHRNDTAYEQIYKKPLLAKVPDIPSVLRKLNGLLSNG